LSNFSPNYSPHHFRTDSPFVNFITIAKMENQPQYLHRQSAASDVIDPAHQQEPAPRQPQELPVPASPGTEALSRYTSSRAISELNSILRFINAGGSPTREERVQLKRQHHRQNKDERPTDLDFVSPLGSNQNDVDWALLETKMSEVLGDERRAGEYREFRRPYMESENGSEPHAQNTQALERLSLSGCNSTPAQKVLLMRMIAGVDEALRECSRLGIKYFESQAELVRRISQVQAMAVRLGMDCPHELGSGQGQENGHGNGQGYGQ